MKGVIWAGRRPIRVHEALAPHEPEARAPTLPSAPDPDPRDLADDPEFRQWVWEEQRPIPRVGWP